jgi:hypothetical protein
MSRVNTKVISSRGLTEYYLYPIEKDLAEPQITIRIEDKSISLTHFSMVRDYIKQKITPTNKCIYCLTSTENKDLTFRKELVTLESEIFLINISI